MVFLVVVKDGLCRGGHPRAAVAGGSSGPGGMAAQRSLFDPCRAGRVETEEAPPVSPSSTHLLIPCTAHALLSVLRRQFAHQ